MSSLTDADSWLVVGIGGASCSGKTTVANMLKNTLPHNVITVIHQDDYYHPIGSDKLEYIQELGFHNWDVPSAFDFDRLLSDVENIISEKPMNGSRNVIIVEGNVFLIDHRIWDVCRKKYFLTLTFDVASERRKLRSYEPPDVPGYFEKIVWPEYIALTEKLSDRNEGLVFLNSSESVQEAFKVIYETIGKYLNN